MLFLCYVPLWPLYDSPVKLSTVPEYSSGMKGQFYTERRLLSSNICHFYLKVSCTIFNWTLFEPCQWCWICAMLQTFSNNSPIGIKKGAFVRRQHYIIYMLEGTLCVWTALCTCGTVPFLAKRPLLLYAWSVNAPKSHRLLIITLM